MSRSRGAVLLVFVLACGSPPVADTDPPLISVVAVEPSHAALGATVTLRFDASEPLPAGAPTPSPNPQVVFAGGTMACTGDAARRAFTCAVAVAAPMPEGEHGFEVTAADAAGNVRRTEIRSPRVTLDYTPPGAVVAAEPASVVQGGTVAVDIRATEDLGAPPVVAGAAFDGAPACVGPVPGGSFRCSGRVGVAAAAGPTTYTVDLTDRAGNAGRVTGLVVVTVPLPEILGATVQPDPARAGDLLVVDIALSGTVDTCRASLSATPASCSAPGAGVCTCTLLVEPEFPEGAVTLTLEAENSAGLATGSAAAHLDHTPPRVADATALVLVRTPRGVVDRVRGEPGALVDEGTAYPGQQVDRARVLDLGGAVLGEGPVNADGSFADIDLGDVNLDRVRVVPVDRAGHAGAAVLARTVEGTYTLAGRVPNDDASTPLSLWPVVSASDPRGASPDLVGAEATTAQSAAASTVDGSVARVLAPPELAAARGWRLLKPSRRVGHKLVYDGGRGRIVLFGGSGTSDVWTYDGTQWRYLPLPARPPGRQRHGLVYDSARSRIVLHGGNDAPTDFNDTWELDAAGWTEVNARVGFSADTYAELVYDAGRGLTVLFGGPRRYNETWEYDGTAWIQRSPVGTPTGRYGQGFAYDSARGKVVMFGGDDFGRTLADTWEYDGTSWVETTPTISPPGRVFAGMTYDSARGRVVMFGGERWGPNVRFADTWEYDGTSWVETTPAPSPPAGQHSIAYDEGRGRVVLLAEEADTWEYDGTTWTETTPALPAPMSEEAAVAYDTAKRRVVLFGGLDGATRLSDTWELDGGTWSFASYPTTPPARSHAAMVYDSARGRAVLFGGQASNTVDRGDTWELDGTGWQEVTPATAPPARGRHALAYDALRGRTVLFGGFAGQALADTWEFDGVVWTETTPAFSPPARYDHAMAYDAARGTVVLFGGARWPSYLGDTWTYDGVTWTSVWTAAAPSDRSRHAMVYDPEIGRVLLFGHHDPTEPAELWEFDGARWQETNTADTVHTRTDPKLVFDETSRRTLLLGGAAGNTYGRMRHDDVWMVPGAARNGARFAAHLATLLLDPAGAPSVVEATWVGAGAGEAGPSLELHAWEPLADAWVLLASHVASESDPAAARTLVAAVPAAFVENGRLHVLAAAPASSAPPGTVDSEVVTDYVELRVTYVLP